MRMSARVIKANSNNFTAFSPMVVGQHGKEQKELNNTFSGNTGEVKEFVFPRLKSSKNDGFEKEQPLEQEEHDVQAFHSPYLSESEEKARKIIEDANAEAENLIEIAKAHVEEIERKAFIHGEAEGRASVSMEIDKQVSDLREQLSGTLTELQYLKSETESKAEREMVELAIEIAKKIVQREVTVDREVALTLARVALTRLHSRSTTIIRLHPDDYTHAAAHRERLESDGAIEIVEDRSVGLGGCLIQTEMGDIDARIAHQFREIEKGFWGELPY